MASRRNQKSSEQSENQLENFTDILSLTAEDVDEPSLYPSGPWLIKNRGYSTSDGEDRDGNPQLIINFRYEGFQAGPEVDPDLVEQGGFEGRTLWVRRYISKPAVKASRDGTLARFINFIAMHDVDVSGRTLDDMCKAVKGFSILADLGTRSYTNREGDTVTDNTATNFAPASGVDW